MQRSSKTQLCASAVKVDITPDNLSGLNPTGGDFSRVHDPLHLRALVLRSGSVTFGMISLDVIEIGDTVDIRRRIETETGLPFEHILITATHTHNAPRVGAVSPGALALADRPEFQAFTVNVYDAIVAALKSALADLRPARFGYGTGSVDVNVNRDEFTAGEWTQGRDDRGPSDKTLRILRVDHEDGIPLAVVMNYGVHSTVAFGAGEVSADLAGSATDYYEKIHGGGVVALWITGSLGDQNPRVMLADVTDPVSPDRELVFEAVRAQGVMVGAEAARISTSLNAGTSEVTLRASALTFSCPTQPSSDDRDESTNERAGFVDLDLQLFLINDIALCCAGGEIVTEVAREIRAASALSATVVMSLVNNRIGYLTTDEAYVRRTFHSVRNPMIEGYAEPHLVDGFGELIEQAMADARPHN